MERVLDQYMHILRRLAQADGSTALSKLEIITSTDLHWIHALNENIPSRVYQCVHEKVEQQVAVQPQAQAIASFDRDWTYSELDLAASHLASKLRRRRSGNNRASVF